MSLNSYTFIIEDITSCENNFIKNFEKELEGEVTDITTSFTTKGNLYFSVTVVNPNPDKVENTIKDQIRQASLLRD